MNYLVADFIIRLKNATRARRREVILPYSKFNKAVGSVLAKEKFLDAVKEETIEGKKVLSATITYTKRTPSFTNVEILSKPSLRTYARAQKNALQGRGIGTTIVSTSHGVMTGKDAFKKGVGGEVLFKIW